MTFKDNLGWLARCMFALIGLFLLVVAVATIYHDWPQVVAHRSSLVGFVLTCLIALPLGLLIIVWAVIGQTKAWHIAGDHIRVNLMSLTAWQREIRLTPDEIAEVCIESYAHDEEGRRTAHWVIVTTVDGRRFKSPRVYDAMVIEVLHDRVTDLKGTGRGRENS